ncbi:hypothetical protein DRQ33_05390 [bacterium]|mgnify:CR=1 FL=1|nr:MAG: hypothetical protein DRQ33_05390 [bacterium]
MALRCAIIGDIKGSREMDNWVEVFSSLQDTLEMVNEKYSDNIMIPLHPTAGDEFQGALKTPEKVYDIYVHLVNTLETNFYYAIGFGDIEKPFDDNFGMRGTAFYRAREVLEYCKKKNRRIYVKSTDPDQSEPNLDDKILNTLFLVVEFIENSWTQRQRELVQFYRMNSHLTYQKVGEKFGITEQNANKIINAGNWNLLQESEALIRDILSRK